MDAAVHIGDFLLLILLSEILLIILFSKIPFVSQLQI